jgi:hypothetical protein
MVGKTWEVEPGAFDPAHTVHPAFPERGPLRFIPLMDVGEALALLEKSNTDFQKAFGENKGTGTPRAWYWTPVYVSRKRWLPYECVDHLADIAPNRPRSTPA